MSAWGTGETPVLSHVRLGEVDTGSIPVLKELEGWSDGVGRHQCIQTIGTTEREEVPCDLSQPAGQEDFLEEGMPGLGLERCSLQARGELQATGLAAVRVMSQGQ